MCVYITSVNNVKQLDSHHDVSQSPLEVFGISEAAKISETVKSDADPVTMSMLKLTYQKMQSGTCQLPQAAMLPPEQRHAFLLFINKGVVEVQNVENLRLAINYVTCLYPQELMHPTGSTGNRL